MQDWMDCGFRQGPNTAPEVTASGPPAITLPATAMLTGTAADMLLTGQTCPTRLSIAWSQVSGPGTVTFMPNPNVAEPTATFSEPGEYVLRLTASDGTTVGILVGTTVVPILVPGLSASADVTITVNTPPTVTASGPQSITIPDGAPLSSLFNDDGLPDPPGTVTLTWGFSGPGTVTFTPNPNVAAPTATFSAPGEYVLTLTASDGLVSNSDDVAITVQPPGTPIARAGAPQTVTLPGGATTTSVTLDGSASAVTAPGATLTTFNWTGTPDPDNVAKPTVTLGVGTHIFTLMVTDSLGTPSAPARVTITVRTPSPPIARAGMNRTVTVPGGGTTTSVMLDGSASTATEPGATLTTFNWTGTPDPANVVQPTVTLGVGSHTFTLVVTDSLGTPSTPATVTVIININLSPTANAGPDQEVDESLEGLPIRVTLDGSASTDPDGTIASYSWTQTAGPPAVLDDATIAKPTFIAPVAGALDGFAPGDHVPGFVLSPSPGGVTPEIRAHGTYANGQWTIMLTRPLMTPDADGDVQFDFTNPANTYPFSIAYLDNTGAAPPRSAAAAVMSTQDTRAYTLGNASSGADLRAVQETPGDCSAFTGVPLQTSPASRSVVPALTLRAAYDSANVYLCVEAPDPNRQADEEKELWEFVGPEPTDWQRLPGSDNVMGGRVGAFDEDRLALWWNINAQDFATQGCAALCHDGRMRSRNADGRADLWYWKAARTNPIGFAEDQRLDPDRARCPDTPCRQLDADTLPIARANSRSFDAVTLPAYVAHTTPEADVRFLIDGAVPPQCPGETCAPAVLAALSDDPLTFELTVTDNLGLRSAPDSVTITIRDVDRDEDSDGVRDTIENGAPNNGDGNNDGIQDILQPHVTSLPNTGNRGYITLVSPQGTTLADVRFLPNPPAGAPPDLRFPWGFLTFTVLDVPPGGAVTVTLLPPPNTTLAADAFYFKFGPTPETPGDHFYRFTFDGTTGAEILPDRIQLRLIDGGRGDHDLSANGRITDPGALAIAAPPLPTVAKDSGGGGGCSILLSGQRTHSRPGDALGNILLPLLALLILYGWRRVAARPTLQRFFRAASRSKPPGVDGSARSSHDIFLTMEADND